MLTINIMITCLIGLLLNMFMYYLAEKGGNGKNPYLKFWVIPYVLFLIMVFYLIDTRRVKK